MKFCCYHSFICLFLFINPKYFALFSKISQNSSGKFVNHKGRNRHFTSPEDLEEERKAEESKRWRKKKDDNDSGEEEEESGSEKSGSEESGSESESDEDDRKKGGAHGLIEIENPNRIQKKQVVKVSTLKVDDEDQGE